jgi:hypothetical protein
MQTYQQATNRLLEGLISEDPSLETLRKSCLEGEALRVVTTKIEKLLKRAHDKGAIEKEFIKDYLKRYDDCRLEVKEATEAVPFDVFVLSESVSNSLKKIQDLFGELTDIVVSFEKQQKDKEEEASRHRKLEEDRLASETEAKLAEERRAHNEHKLLEKQRREEEEKRILLIKAAISKGENWRSGINLYRKKAFRNLFLGVILSVLYVFVFLSWKAGPPVALLMILAIAVVGPIKLEGLVKNRLADSSGDLIRFDGWLGLKFVGGLGIFQAIAGLIGTIIIWFSAKDAGVVQILFPIGWRALAGCFIVLPLGILISWCWGGFFAGRAAARILKKTKLENLLAPGEAYTQCTLCDYCGPVVFDSSKGVATCNKCEGTFALSH